MYLWKNILRTATVLTILVIASSLVHAGISVPVYNAFRGSIVISKAPLPQHVKGDAAMVRAFRKASLKKIHHTTADELSTWSFHYTVFMKRNPPVAQLSFDFYAGKDYVASKRVGVDTSTKILAGSMTLSEDDNLSAGKVYQIKLVAELNGREITLAKTKLAL